MSLRNPKITEAQSFFEKLGLWQSLNPLHDLTPWSEVYPEIPSLKIENTLVL